MDLTTLARSGQQTFFQQALGGETRGGGKGAVGQEGEPKGGARCKTREGQRANPGVVQGGMSRGGARGKIERRCTRGDLGEGEGIKEVRR